MCKKHIVIFTIISIFFLSLSILYTAPKVSIRVNGKWTIGNLDENDLTGGAGTDFPGTWESVPDLIDIDVIKAQDYWQVEISKVDAPWPSQVQVWARRTTDGTGSPATITGGSTYQQVTGTDQPFFSGTGDVTAIKVQLKLEGVTVGVNMDDYTTIISYTVTDGYSDWP
jgi:hypothetical protein